MVGGGTCPDVQLASWTVRLGDLPGGPDALARRLREGSRPVVARIEDDEVVLDLRSVLPEDQEGLAAALVEALNHPS
jgi:L-seryl-tRNA(Ser) seleniumtransferase